MVERDKKVAVIGSGNVGANTAFLVALLGVADVALVDIVEGLAEGTALDISHALAILRLDDKVTGGQDYSLIDGADIVAVTAGSPRMPGMSRTDLLHKNAGVIKAVCAEVKKRAPGAILIVVTNPLDVMTHLAWRETGFEPEKVIGMGGLLDSGRFTHFLSEASGKDRSLVKAMVIGAHSDEMVPLTSQATIEDKHIGTLMDQSTIADVAEETRHGGAGIVKLLKTGSAAYGPAAALSAMVNSIIIDEKQIFSVCCLARGQYGQDGIYLNLPASLGAGGVDEIIEMTLSDDENKALTRSVSAIQEMLKELD